MPDSDTPDHGAQIITHPAFYQGWKAHIQTDEERAAFIEAHERNPNQFNHSPWEELLVIQSTQKMLEVPVTTVEEFFEKLGVAPDHPAAWDGRYWGPDGELLDEPREPREALATIQIQENMAALMRGEEPIHTLPDSGEPTPHLRLLHGIVETETEE